MVWIRSHKQTGILKVFDRYIVDWNLQCGIPYIEDVVGQDGIIRLKQQANHYRTYFDETRPECFLDDITIKNVIMLNGELQGIIDLDWVCYGDSLNMLGLTQASIIADVDYDALVYFDELCQYWDLSNPQRGIVDFYSIVHATNLVRLGAAFQNSVTCEALPTRCVEFSLKRSVRES